MSIILACSELTAAHRCCRCNHLGTLLMSVRAELLPAAKRLPEAAEHQEQQHVVGGQHQQPARRQDQAAFAVDGR